MKSFSDSYKAAGVDVTAGYKAVELMKEHTRRTMIPGVLSGLGGFGGLFGLDVSGMREPVLVSGTDGVGTKIRLAQLMGQARHHRHRLRGHVRQRHRLRRRASPCFSWITSPAARMCRRRSPPSFPAWPRAASSSGCALIGGETAEHPGVMPDDDYDLAGFTVGVVDKEKILDQSNVKEGDAIIALPSSGIHSNGFSLIRKVFDLEGKGDFYSPELGGGLFETLLTPTNLYVKPVLHLMGKVPVHSVCHITGGGFYENIPRALPQGLSAKIEKKNVRVLPIFDLIAKEGNVPEHDMFNTYNMGVGMCCILPSDKADEAIRVLKEMGQEAYVLGEVVKSDEGVILW